MRLAIPTWSKCQPELSSLEVGRFWSQIRAVSSTWQKWKIQLSKCCGRYLVSYRRSIPFCGWVARPPYRKSINLANLFDAIGGSSELMAINSIDRWIVELIDGKRRAHWIDLWIDRARKKFDQKNLIGIEDPSAFMWIISSLKQLLHWSEYG